MRVLVVLALAWSCSGQLVTVPYQYSAYPYQLGIKYQGTDVFGQTTFGHQSFDQTRHEVRLADGRVIGQFSYIDPNGEPAITYFEAGPQGYRVLGSNILPEAPKADLAPPVNDLVAPEPVAYTAEVADARAEFMKIYQEMAAAAAGAPDDAQLKTAPAEEPAAVEPAAEVSEPAESPSATLTADATVAEESAEEPAAEEPVESARRRREVTRVPLPYFRAVPTETETTIETKQFEPVKAATPADTTKIELTTKEHVFKVPGVKYEQQYAEIKPVKYTALAPQVFPYQAARPFYPFAYPGLQYPTLLTPVAKEEAEE